MDLFFDVNLTINVEEANHQPSPEPDMTQENTEIVFWLLLMDSFTLLTLQNLFVAWIVQVV